MSPPTSRRAAVPRVDSRLAQRPAVSVERVSRRPHVEIEEAGVAVRRHYLDQFNVEYFRSLGMEWKPDVQALRREVEEPTRLGGGECDGITPGVKQRPHRRARMKTTSTVDVDSPPEVDRKVGGANGAGAWPGPNKTALLVSLDATAVDNYLRCNNNNRTTPEERVFNGAPPPEKKEESCLLVSDDVSFGPAAPGDGGEVEIVGVVRRGGGAVPREEVEIVREVRRASRLLAEVESSGRIPASVHPFRPPPAIFAAAPLPTPSKQVTVCPDVVQIPFGSDQSDLASSSPLSLSLCSRSSGSSSHLSSPRNTSNWFGSGNAALSDSLWSSRDRGSEKVDKSSQTDPRETRTVDCQTGWGCDRGGRWAVTDGRRGGSWEVLSVSSKEEEGDAHSVTPQVRVAMIDVLGGGGRRKCPRKVRGVGPCPAYAHRGHSLAKGTADLDGVGSDVVRTNRRSARLSGPSSSRNGGTKCRRVGRLP